MGLQKSLFQALKRLSGMAAATIEGLAFPAALQGNPALPGGEDV
jgi:hypothetical protein